jgi:hypothetical protein
LVNKLPEILIIEPAIAGGNDVVMESQVNYEGYLDIADIFNRKYQLCGVVAFVSEAKHYISFVHNAINDNWIVLNDDKFVKYLILIYINTYLFTKFKYLRIGKDNDNYKLKEMVFKNKHARLLFYRVVEDSS